MDKDTRKDWRKRLLVKKGENGQLEVEPSGRKWNATAEAVGRTLFGLGYRYLKDSVELPGRPHFYVRKWNAAIFVCHCQYLPGYEHDCWKPHEKTEDALGTVEENTRLLELLTGAIERLGVRVEVIFGCQVPAKLEGFHEQRAALGSRLTSFLEGEHSYGGRDPLAWLKRKGDPATYGLSDPAPQKFLLPAITGHGFHVGRFGEDHAEIMSSLPVKHWNGASVLKFGYADNSGAFLNARTALVYARRHKLLPDWACEGVHDLRIDWYMRYVIKT